MTPPTDAQAVRTTRAAECRLVTLARQGDSDAFGALYGAYRYEVYAYIRHRVRNAAVAEDFTSETFLRALCRIDSFTWQGRTFGAWLVVIARNLVIDHYRSSPVRREVSTGEVSDGGAHEPAPEDEVIEDHTNAALWAAVGELTPPQRDCVTLRFRCGMSVAETARLMGKREGAVKTLTHRALRSLARALTADHRAVAACA